jgi:cystathionine gamma-synthase
VDTLKIQQRFQPADCRFFSRGSSADLNALAELLQHQKISAVFCETPANPLLICPDLIRLRQLADQYGFLLIVDDTLAACINLDVLPLADLVVTSLTKYFSGYGDVLAGSVTLNRHSGQYLQLSQWMDTDFQELLSDIDVDVLEQNSRDVVSRVTTINHNAQVIAQRLSQHPAVEQVWHPSVHQQHEYHQLQRVGGGYGGLLSFVVRSPGVNTQAVFDHLAVCKGPNLGTYFTLCCPYTILAHYNELDAVEEYGVSRWLLRVSIGTEPVEELWLRFQTALQHVTM